MPWRLFGCQCLSGWSTVAFISYADIWRCSSVNKFGKLCKTVLFLFGILPYLIAQLTPSTLLPICSLWRSRLTTWALHRCGILINIKLSNTRMWIFSPTTSFSTAINLTCIKSLLFFLKKLLNQWFFLLADYCSALETTMFVKLCSLTASQDKEDSKSPF